DLSDDEQAAARALSAQIRFELQDYSGAEQGWRSAAQKMGDKNYFTDDAEFAAIHMKELQGRDKEAADDWKGWMDKYPQSPLRGEATLALAWNALRRGDVTVATKQLALLSQSQPWLETDPRVTLAKGTLLYTQGKPVDALAAVGIKTTGPAASYLRGLCYRAQGAVLQSAASFQEVADRYPESPLRDPAMLAKADAILRGIVERYGRSDVAARAQFLVGEVLMDRGQYPEAIIQMNQVLKEYFQHSVAASAQYAVGRCLDAMGRKVYATGSYQAVVSGYPLEPEAPAAAYLAGVGLLSQNKPRVAAPYFQIVLDRYVAQMEHPNLDMFKTSERIEVVDASLCLLMYSYHQAGDLGQLAGAPHMLLQKMPPSSSPWRAYALLIDADASAAQARYPEAQASLEK